jgi:hypothetical protein
VTHNSGLHFTQELDNWFGSPTVVSVTLFGTHAARAQERRLATAA